MKRAIDLALNGLGKVSPNPLVGCVIVHNKKIIGEGWHEVFGGNHAEVQAINSVENKDLLKESTLYVTLEPCSHFGKTPPCSDLIIKHNIPKVIICNNDPFDEVNGKGIHNLKKAGTKIEIGILEDLGLKINNRFFTSIKKKRPYITLKWAQTNDGFVARKNFDSKWISNELSRKFVHKLRADEDAILVGYNTVKHDNPTLNVRDWVGENPLRIVIDENLELNKDLNIFDGTIDTVCYNSKESKTSNNLEYKKIDFNNLEENILTHLKELEIQSVIIEGGAKTIQKFIDNNLWDEANVFIGNEKFEDGIKCPKISIEPFEEHNLLEHKLKIYKNV